MSRSRHTEAQMIAALNRWKQVERRRMLRESAVYRSTRFTPGRQVRRDGCDAGTGRQAIGDGPVAGQGSAAIGDSKKRLELVAMNAAIGQIREEYAFTGAALRSDVGG